MPDRATLGITQAGTDRLYRELGHQIHLSAELRLLLEAAHARVAELEAEVAALAGAAATRPDLGDGRPVSRSLTSVAEVADG